MYLYPKYKVFIAKMDEVVATQHLQHTWNRLKLLQQEVASDLFGTEPDSFKISSADNDLDILIKAGERTDAMM